MVKPVPAVGSFHIGSPSHCAAAGVASNVNPSVSAARFIVPSQRQGEKPCGDQGARSRRRWSYGKNRGPASQSCVALMHPHGADRHTGRLVEVVEVEKVGRSEERRVGKEWRSWG